MPDRRTGLYHFFAGALMAAIGLAIVGLLVIARVGWIRAAGAIGINTGRPPLLDMPPAVAADLVRVGAVGENFGEPSRRHDTFFVEPAPVVGYRLRPDVAADVIVLAPRGDLNLDPPTISLPAGAVLAEPTERFLEESGRLRFRYTTTAQRMRATLPSVASDDQVLVIGDSVAFGVGVDDAHTVASHLQQLLGPSMQVLNAGVAGYGASQVLATAETLTRHRRYRALVYVAFENDFIDDADARDAEGAWRERAAQTVQRLAALAARCDRVIMFLVTSLDYEARKVLLSEGPDQATIRLTRELGRELSRLAHAANVIFGEWTDLVNEHRAGMATVLAPFALYSDHAHLSRAGNRLLAESLSALLTATPPGS